MGEENRVLTDEEILAMEDGARVYVEEARFRWLSEWHTKQGTDLVGDSGARYSLDREYDENWRKMDPDDPLCPDDARPWLREPTAEELDANPWPTPIVEV